MASDHSKPERHKYVTYCGGPGCFAEHVVILPRSDDAEARRQLLAAGWKVTEFSHRCSKCPEFDPPPQALELAAAREVFRAAVENCPKGWEDELVLDIATIIAKHTARLRDALLPFAALAKRTDELGHEDESTCEWRIRAKDLRIARAALAAPAGAKEGR